jgi:DNA-binding MarR family transcriptional regulator
MARKPARSKGMKLDDSPGHLLRRCQQFSFDLFSEEVGASGLTPRQFTVLLTVDQNEGLSQTDLVQLTGIDRSTLADMISRLLKRGLLARKRTENDARANSVKITASGRKAMNGAMNGVKRAETRILAPLPAGKRKDFMRNLTLIAEAGAEAEAAAQSPKAKAPARRAAKAPARRKPAAKRKAPAKKKRAKKR